MCVLVRVSGINIGNGNSHFLSFPWESRGNGNEHVVVRERKREWGLLQRMGGNGNRKLIRADLSTERMWRGQLSKPLFPDHHSVTAVCLMLVLRSEQSVRVVYDCGCRLKHECEDFFSCDGTEIWFENSIGICECK